MDTVQQDYILMLLGSQDIHAATNGLSKPSTGSTGTLGHCPWNHLVVEQDFVHAVVELEACCQHACIVGHCEGFRQRSSRCKVLVCAAAAARQAQQAARIGLIREVLPEYGEGFLAACLDAVGQDSERVIHQLLEGSLPPELARLDPHMPLLPVPAAPPTTAASKGKGRQSAAGANTPEEPFAKFLFCVMWSCMLLSGPTASLSRLDSAFGSTC